MNLAPTPVHDFIDVEDVVEGIINLSQHSARGIYELGTGRETSNNEVKIIVEEITGKKANVNIVGELRDYDIDHDWVSLNYKARGYGWLAKKTLEQSIKEQVDYVKRTGKKSN